MTKDAVSYGSRTASRVRPLLGFWLVWLSAGMAQTAPPDLTNMSLEDLMNVKVTSVSKKEQNLSTAGAAVFVLNHEDILRSGASNIPDLLRLVPGVNVAQINSNSWSISIRGFSDVYSNKVLVLIDGRSVYNTLNSGVFWDEWALPVETIERIEVIRGPGGTMWGANAVNGVINIITMRARDSQGGMIRAGSGSRTSADGLAQYGGEAGNGYYSVFGRYFNTNPAVQPDGSRAADGWHDYYGGFRSEWDLTPRDNLTVQGDYSRSAEGDTLRDLIFSARLPLQADFNDTIAFQNANILSRWTHTFSNGSDMSLQTYYDYTYRLGGGMTSSVHTGDLDFQHHLKIGSRNDVVWGFGYRAESDYSTPGFDILFQPAHRFDRLYSAFVQDQIALTHKLSLIIGSKFENNAYTGYEDEPSAQLVWQATKSQTLWASAAKAIRQPALLDLGIYADVSIVPTGYNTWATVAIEGQPHPLAEELRDFELGYRVQLKKRLSLDFTAFDSNYHDLESSEPLAPQFVTGPGVPHLVFPIQINYQAHAQNLGGEAFATWEISKRWRVSPGYSRLRMDTQENAGWLGSPLESQYNNPGHKFEVRSMLDVTRKLDWDSSVAYVARTQLAPSYTRVDTRLGWRLGERTDLSVVGQNLLAPRHAEYSDQETIGYTLVQRSVSAKITWHF